MVRHDVTPPVSRNTVTVSAFKGIDAKNDKKHLSLDYGSYSYNVKVAGGALTRGKGIEEPTFTQNGVERTIPSLLNFNKNLAKAHYYRHYDYDNEVRDDRLFVVSTNGYYYECGLTSGEFVYRPEIVSNVGTASFVNYFYDDKDYLFIYTGDRGLYTYDGTLVVKREEVPGFSDVCLHYDRVYGVSTAEQNKIRFSAALDPADFTTESGGGYISLLDDGGKIIRLVAFKDYIYIFREHAIHRLIAYTDPSEYSLSKVFSTASVISADSVAVAHGRMIFLADGELYSYDGVNMERLFSNLTPLIEDTSAVCSVYYGNCYYLAAKLKTENGEKIGDEVSAAQITNNGMLVLDLWSGEYSVFRGADVRGFFPVVADGMSELFVLFNNGRSKAIGRVTDTGALFGAPLKKVFLSPEVDFGRLTQYKVLRRICVDTAYDLRLTASVDGKTSEKAAAGNPYAPNVFTYNLTGNSVSYRIESDAQDFYVSKMQFVIDTGRKYYGN